jgi:hypothetical protein
MKRTLVLTLAFVGATAVPASAFLFGGTIVNDITANVKLAEQYVQQGQQYAMQVQQYAAQVKNLAKMPVNYANVQSEVASISGQSKGIAAQIRGTSAANQIIVDSSSDAAETARLNGLAAQAQGANQQATVSNGYLSHIDYTLQKGNVAAAAARQQDAANAVQTAGDLTTMTGNEPGTVSEQQL